MRRRTFAFAPVALHPLASPKGRPRERHRPSAPANTRGGPDNARAKSFWGFEAETVAPHDLKRAYAEDRFLDKKTRFVVRQRVREEGVTSNLFPLEISPASTLYAYEIEATRRLFNAPPPETEPGGKGREGRGATRRRPKREQDARTSHAAGCDSVVKRVDSTRAWRVVQRFLRRQFPAAPPVINVRQKVYATSPLPVDALQLPAEYFDLGWNACKLQFLGKVSMTQMTPEDVQEVCNKIVLWALGYQGNLDTKFSVAKEANGKVVCAHDCFVSGGLRIFKGTILRTVFIDAGGAVEEQTLDSSGMTVSSPPSTAVLTTLSEGSHLTEPLRFFVKEFLREFVFKETPVQSYRVEDASGVIMASLWQATKASKLISGVTYEVTDYRVRVFENRGGMRLLEMTVGKTTFKVVEDENTSPTTESTKKRKRKGGKQSVEENAPQTTKGSTIVPNNTKEGSVPDLPGVLSLKIDTKSTVAAELSLWEEVKQHFGNGPYDSATEERIARSLQGTPVITSATLRHSSIRLVRFNIVSGDVDLDPALVRFRPDLEPGQPCAVLMDHAVVPLQALHCCYDPRSKSWQEICVSACSFMPSRRVDILQMFRAMLESKIRQWGLALAPQPLLSKELSLLPAPQKVMPSAREASEHQGVRQRGKHTSSPLRLRHPPPPSFPTTIAVIAIAATHIEEDERARITQTAQTLARHYRSTTTITVSDEQEAVQFLLQQLTNANDGTVKDPNALAVIITPERQTRPSRWISAECLTRGILVLFLPPAASPKRQELLCANVRMRLRTSFETDPARGVNLAKEVPALAQRRVLVVGVDACHTSTFSTGSVVGILCAPERNHLLPFFWKQETRGMEADQVADYFRRLLDRAGALYDGLDEVIVFQDGDVHSEMHRMRAQLPPNCGFTYMCLHKRTNIRFVHQMQEERRDVKVKAGNVVKGAVVQALTPVSLSDDVALSSFYLQNHDCNMSTARTVHYTVHSISPTFDVSDAQQLSHVLSHVLASQATKLPMPTRCAHRLASVAERLLDAAPPLTCDMIPAPLNERLWFF